MDNKTFHVATAAVVLLFLRVTVGWSFFLSGKGKLTNLERTVDYFTSLGIPYASWNALFAAGTELIGGLMLILGFCSRIISLPLTVTMCVAYYTAHWGDVSSLGDFADQAPFPYLLASLVILITGAGFLSVDQCISRWCRITLGRVIRLSPFTLLDSHMDDD